MTTAGGRRWIDRLVVPWTARIESPSTLRPVPGWVLVSSALIPTLLTSAWLVADALQPPTYSPMRQTVSVLSGYGGTDRWIVTAALYAVGAAYLLTALGLGTLSTASRTGLVVAGVAAIGIAWFPQPIHGTNPSHAACTGIGAVTIAVWPALVARQDVALSAVGRRRSIAAILVSGVLFVWTVVQTGHGTALGLAERTSSALQVCWPFVVTLALRRAQSAAVRQE